MMIRLIFKIRGQTVEKSFSQSTVTIGLESPDIEGLPLDTSELDRDHLRFVDQNGEIYAINQANDPFVTLNGRPFGRKKLSGGDRLEIGEMEILFTGGPAGNTAKSLSEVLDQKIRKVASPPAADSDDDLSALIAQVEGLENEEDEPTEEPAPVIIHQNPPLSNDSFRTSQSQWRHQREETEEFHQSDEDFSSKPSIWGSVIAYVAVLLAIIAAVGSGVYFTFSEQSDTQEFLAAEGLADISMAFTYAHLYQIKPAHQNGLDPDFIHETLVKFLPEEAVPYVQLDKQSHFVNTEYLLRAYSTPDLSRFVLIAQPNPTLLQWILPRETIVIDSQSMELRRTTDIKELNRLLANPNPLDGMNAAMIFKLLNGAELVRLSTLAQETGHMEFNPPANLSHVRLAAASLVYNAPRYHLFTQPLILALAGGTTQEGEEQRALEDLLRTWKGFPNLVLYAKDNKELANRAFKSLKERFPHETFLVGYLGPNSDNSTILTEPLPYNEPLDPYLYDFQGQEATAILEAPVTHDEETMRLASRKRELRPIAKAIKRLFDVNTSAPESDFYDKLNVLLEDYKRHDLGLQPKTEALVLAVEEPSLRVVQTEEDETSREAIDAVQDKFQRFSDQIQETKSLLQLQIVARDIALWEKLAREEAPARFSILSNKLKTQSLRRLELLLFSATSPLNQEDLQPRQRVVVQSILNNVGVDDPYQRDYYLKEFDLLVERN